jgi:hypothetical protein
LKEEYQGKSEKCSSAEQQGPIYSEPSIAYSLVKAFGIWQLIIGMIYYFISALLAFVPVIILNDSVKFFESGVSLSEWDGYVPPWVKVAALGVVPVMISILQTRHQTIMVHCAVFVRTSVSTMLYRKALRVSAA